MQIFRFCQVVSYYVMISPSKYEFYIITYLHNHKSSLYINIFENNVNKCKNPIEAQHSIVQGEVLRLLSSQQELH